MAVGVLRGDALHTFGRILWVRLSVGVGYGLRDGALATRFDIFQLNNVNILSEGRIKIEPKKTKILREIPFSVEFTHDPKRLECPWPKVA